MRRRRINTNSDSDSTFELDLSPMLALMVTLIPVMLLATVFVRVTIIETSLPQLVEKAIEEDRNKKDRSITFKVEMDQQKGFDVIAFEGPRVIYKKNIPLKNTKWDLQTLHGELYSLKTQHPKIFRLDLLPGENVKYDDLVKVMDEARNSKSEEKKFSFPDKDSGQLVETGVMFPDVVFAGIMEG
ncbi:MAG: biopolymer transporter ExbD [Bdellovibrionales bacterium]|nr:biopolymer transporter ExbD [Bdellovibrionales bacterium]